MSLGATASHWEVAILMSKQRKGSGTSFEKTNQCFWEKLKRILEFYMELLIIEKAEHMKLTVDDFGKPRNVFA